MFHFKKGNEEKPVFEPSYCSFHIHTVGRAHCNKANIPGTVFSYRRWPHQGDGCRAHISSLLRSQNSENEQFSQEAVLDETDSVSSSQCAVNFNAHNAMRQQIILSAQKQRDHLACLTNLMVALLLIT